MLKILQGTISYPEVKWGKPEDRAAKNTPLSEFVDSLATVGADGIELWGRHLDGLTSAQVDDLAAKIKDSGQTVDVLGPYWDFSSSDQAAMDSLEDARRWLAIRDTFDADKIRIFAGAPGSAEATEDNWTRAVAGMRRLARLYEGSGVTFIIETHGDQLPDTVESALRLVKELDEPSILLNYQIMGGDTAAELDAVYEWIAHAHVSFASRWTPTAEKTIAELVKRGYSGSVTVEFCTDSLPEEGVDFDLDKAIAGMTRDIAALRALLR